MPPKKTRAVARTTDTKKLFVSVSTQTVDFDEEIKSQQAKIEILEQENAGYKELVAKLESQLQNKDAIKLHVVQKSAVKARNDKISSPISGSKVAKGCSCKGNCSNKICGCVKKGLSCREFCRCNDAQCRNQDKENVHQQELCEDGQKALEKFNSLTLNQEFLHSSGKKAKRGLFSPFGDGNGAHKVASPLSLETRRRLFSQDSNDIVDVNTNSDEENASSIQSHYSNTTGIKNLKTTQTPVAKRTRRLNLGGTKSELKESTNERQTFLMTLQTEEGNEIKTINSNEIEEHQNNNEQAARRALKLSDIVTTKNANEIEKDAFMPTSIKRVVHSPPAPRIINMPSVGNFQDQGNPNIDEENENDPEIGLSSENITHRSNKNQETSNQQRVLHSPQPVMNNTEIQSNRESEATTSSFESNASDDIFNKENLDVSLNPMMPKRQLPRSPINKSGQLIVPTKDKRFSPPKKELAVAEVDWEQHQLELVMCKKCKRTFFPHRLEKHVVSCKGI